MATSQRYTATKSKLVDLLAARIDGPETKVYYQWERGRATKREAVWFENRGDPTESNTPVATGPARHPRNETFTLNVVIQVADGGAGPDKADEVEARCAALYGELDDLVADDKTLDALDGVLEAKVVGFTPEDIVFGDKGWAVRWVAHVWINTWLS